MIIRLSFNEAQTLFYVEIGRGPLIQFNLHIHITITFNLVVRRAF